MSTAAAVMIASTSHAPASPASAPASIPPSPVLEHMSAAPRIYSLAEFTNATAVSSSADASSSYIYSTSTTPPTLDTLSSMGGDYWQFPLNGLVDPSVSPSAYQHEATFGSYGQQSADQAIEELDLNLAFLNAGVGDLDTTPTHGQSAPMMRYSSSAPSSVVSFHSASAGNSAPSSTTSSPPASPTRSHPKLATLGPVRTRRHTTSQHASHQPFRSASRRAPPAEATLMSRRSSLVDPNTFQGPVISRHYNPNANRLDVTVHEALMALETLETFLAMSEGPNGLGRETGWALGELRCRVKARMYVPAQPSHAHQHQQGMYGAPGQHHQ